jgi:hypothetical protein
MEIHMYLGKIAEHLVHELQPVVEIKEFTNNPVLLGHYAEAIVRKLARRVVHPMRVSTGAVLDYPMPEPLRQLDLIIWAPFPAPALFEVEDFALVPRSSAFGAIEIKRSNYSGTDKCLEDFVEAFRQEPLLTDPVPEVDNNRSAFLGVVPVLEKNSSARLRTLFEDNKAVAIFEQTTEEVNVRKKDVLTLVNFLHYVSKRYHARLGLKWYLQLNPEGL